MAYMNFPYRAPFRRDTLTSWILTNKPTQIGLNDSQYAWLVGDGFDRHLCVYIGGLGTGTVKQIDGIPIHFIDEPRQRS